MITVAVLGAVVSLLSGAIDASRNRRSEGEQQRRESFTTLTETLDRSTRCAQRFYVACQHVRRQHKAKAAATAGCFKRHRIRGTADSHLDSEYQAFATEALSIQTLIKARFGDSSPGAAFDWESDEPAEGGGESWWRWHMVYDLLTIYYFALRGSFPGNSLTTNGIDDKNTHSGFRVVVQPAEPTEPRDGATSGRDPLFVSDELAPRPEELDTLIRTVRSRVPEAIDRFAVALRKEAWRDLPQDAL